MAGQLPTTVEAAEELRAALVQAAGPWGSWPYTGDAATMAGRAELYKNTARTARGMGLEGLGKECDKRAGLYALWADAARAEVMPTGDAQAATSAAMLDNATAG